MNQPINDGGPAFPVVFQHDEATSECYGISIRDYFAAAALQGSIANPNSTGNWEDFALDAYRYADAMLERRKR
jgi:hypothetical protein